MNMKNDGLLREDIKRKIGFMIEKGLFEHAQVCIEDYHGACPEDEDYYSMQACLAIAGGKLSEAEEHVNTGLKAAGRDSFDLLHNLYQIKLLKNEAEEAAAVAVESKLRGLKGPDGVEETIEPPASSDKRCRVLHGTMEIANQMSTLSQGLSQEGVYSKTLCYYPNYLKYQADYVHDLQSFANPVSDIKEVAAQFISDYDVFHFHYSTSLTLDYSDLPLLKSMGKKVLMHHWGSDVRLLSEAEKINPYIKVKTTDEEMIKRTLYHLSQYIDHGIVADYELYLFIKDYYKNIHFIPQALNLEKYPFASLEKRKRPLLVHAPTSPEIKGSKYIVAALENLQHRYKFDFKLIQGMSHEEAKGWYSKADLVIDEILCGAYGMLAIECMSMGKPVISWLTDYIKGHYPSELPLLSANPDTIEQVIKNALDNRDMFPELGRKGRAYVEKYHDVKNVSKQLIELYHSIN
jgi:glycosyltransferase involved in cell wall biosynthesis